MQKDEAYSKESSLEKEHESHQSQESLEKAFGEILDKSAINATNDKTDSNEHSSAADALDAALNSSVHSSAECKSDESLETVVVEGAAAGPVIKPMRERIAAVIPCYNHGTLIETVIKRVLDFGLRCIVVDDGSAQGSVSALKEIVSRYPEVLVLYHKNNIGKGGAVLTGLRIAEDEGFTHILQIDADGQHNLNDLPKFLALSAKYPKAVISGSPIYSAEAPKGRVYGRRITNFWVAVETLSTDIKESMCGYRIYPVKSLMSLYNRDVLPFTMDFDIAALVYLYWDKLDILYVNTKVRYLINGHSNFNMVRDNLKISWMHTKLVLNTLLHLPSRILDRMRRKEEYATLGKRVESFVKEVNDAHVDDNGNLVFKEVHAPLKDGDKHVPSSSYYENEDDAHSAQANSDTKAQDGALWHEQKEQTVTAFGIKSVIAIQKLFGRTISSYLLYPIIGVYWACDAKRRATSNKFLSIVTKRRQEIIALEQQGQRNLLSSQWSQEPLNSYRHFMHFGSSLLDKLNAWRDAINIGDEVLMAPKSVELLQNCLKRPTIFITSHLGNNDMARALLKEKHSDGYEQKLSVLVDENNAQGFAQIMKELAPQSRVSLVQISSVGPDTAIMLKEKLDRNEWIAISADRVSVNAAVNSNRLRSMSFLGKDANFYEGPFILSSLMEVDVVQLFAIKDNDKTFLHAFKLTEGKKVPRSEREAFITSLMDQYVHNLEQLTLSYPLEWFNFFDFWQQHQTHDKK